MANVIEVNQLTKVFKNNHAVKDVSFTINTGEVVALLGPNGAGKTTTMLSMLGLLTPTDGTARLFGKSAKEKIVREKIGVMLQDVNLMDGLKVKEILRLFRSYYPTPLTLEKLIETTGLAEGDLNKRTEKLSGGQKRRVGFALALAGNPDVLFFDEPTVGMDVAARKLFWETVRELASEGKTILFSTHYLQEADDIASRIILFNNGTIIADGSPEEIKRNLSKQSVSFIAEQALSEKLFINEPFVASLIEKDDRTIIITDDTDAVLAKIFALNLQVKDIRIEKGRLEEAFEQLTDKEREVI